MNVILGDGLLATELIGKTGWQYISRKKDGLDFNDELEKVELNIEIDLNRLKNMREGFWDF